MGSSAPVAVVTGAGSGIGRAVAARLAGAGHLVVAVGRRVDPLQQLAADCPPGSVDVRPCDLADAEAVTALVAGVIDRHGCLDTLVNNAGDARQVPIAETTPAFVAATLAVNTVAPAAAITAAWPTFVAQGHGCIVNVSSLAQFDPFPGFFAYAASKAALHLLTVVAHNEGAEAGIRAFTVAPGVVETPLHRRLMPDGVDDIYRHEPDVLAAAIVECVDGTHDAHAGRTLAVVTPSVGVAVREWIAGHPGGGIVVIER